MKKICFSCGKKFNELFSNLCESCFSKKNQIIEDVKFPKLKYCNSCKKILYKNFYYTFEDFKKKFSKIFKDSLVLNSGFELNDFEIESFSIEKENLIFDVDLDVSIK